jgi:effector-binding domain-containing protein
MPLQPGWQPAQHEVMKTYDVQAQTRQTQPTAVITAELPASEIGPWLAQAYRTLAGVMAAHGTSPSGPPFARYHRVAAGRFAVEAGFPVVTAIDADGDARPSYLPGGPVATTVHTGGYGEVASAYAALASWVSDHGGTLEGDPWEVYLTDPARQPDPATWRTEIVQPYGLA